MMTYFHNKKCVVPGSSPWPGLKSIFAISQAFLWASLVAQMVKPLPAGRRPGFDSWSGRSPGDGNGNPLQHFCLENPMDGGA